METSAATGPQDAGAAERLSLIATNTHLYRGARLISEDRLPDEPTGILIIFSDGNRVEAESLQNADGELALEVPSHHTDVGAKIRAKLWEIARTEPGEHGSTVVIVGSQAGEIQ